MKTNIITLICMENQTDQTRYLVTGGAKMHKEKGEGEEGEGQEEEESKTERILHAHTHTHTHTDHFENLKCLNALPTSSRRNSLSGHV